MESFIKQPSTQIPKETACWRSPKRGFALRGKMRKAGLCAPLCFQLSPYAIANVGSLRFRFGAALQRKASRAEIFGPIRSTSWRFIHPLCMNLSCSGKTHRPSANRSLSLRPAHYLGATTVDTARTSTRPLPISHRIDFAETGDADCESISVTMVLLSDPAIAVPAIAS